MRARLVYGGLITLVLALTTACGGSALDPEKVLAANDAVRGQAAGPGTAQVDPSSPQIVDPSDPGVVNPTDPQDPTGAQNSADPQAPTDPQGPGSGSNNPPAGGGVKAASCAGFKNSTGISDSTIKIGNGADVSGPVPGLFTSAQLAVKAYVAYFNATNPDGICGRKLELVTADTRTDGGADLAAYTKFCTETFASVGSMAVVDSGGAATAEKCGLPDVRTAGASPERNACRTCFATQASGDHEYTNAVYDYWIKKNKPATQKAAFLYINVGAAAQNGKVWIEVGRKRGMNWVYTSPIDAADFNYGPYVQQMKSKGVQFVQFIGAYQQSARLLQAMDQGGFKPAVRFFDPSMYDENFIKTTGSAIEGVFMYAYFTQLEASQPELNLYRQWLGQVAPGNKPSFYGVFAWSAAKLFVEKSLGLGGGLTRASLVNALQNTHSWTGGGISSPMDVGGKHAPSCVYFIKIAGGKFTRYDNYSMQNLLCKGYSKG